MADDTESEHSQINDKEEADYQTYPTDKGWAWIIVLGCFGVLGLVVGGIKSFGVLLVELSRQIDAPAKVVTSTQSLVGFLHVALAPLSNALSERFSHRRIIILGGLISGVGFIATSFVQDIGWLFVTYGIITGVGFGLAVSPSLVMMGYHFNQRRALANGLSDSGIGAGSFIFPNLLRVLMTEYGLQGCMLIIGAIMFNICVFGVLFRPLAFWQKKKRNQLPSSTVNIPLLLKYNNHDSVDHMDDKKEMIRVTNDWKKSKSLQELPVKVTLERYTSSSLPCLSLNENESEYLKVNDNETMHNSESGYPEQQFDINSKELQDDCDRTQKPLNNSHNCCCNLSLEWRFLKNIHFLLFNFALVLGIIGQHTVFNCLPSLANEMGFSDQDGALLVSIVGIFDLIGKIFFGWFSDLGILQRQTVFHMNLGLFSVFAYLFPHFHVYIVLCVIGAFAGFLSGGYIGIEIAVLADKFGAEHLSSTWGFVAVLGSFAMLVNPFISGLLKDSTGTWENAFYFCATAAFCGFLLLVVDNVIQKFKNK